MQNKTKKITRSTNKKVPVTKRHCRQTDHTVSLQRRSHNTYEKSPDSELTGLKVYSNFADVRNGVTNGGKPISQKLPLKYRVGQESEATNSLP